MLTWRVLGAAGLALLIAATGAVAADPPEPARDVPTTAPLATLGGHSASLTRLNPLDLAPEGPRVAASSEYKGVYSFAPDGSAVAFGKTVASATAPGFGIRVIDTQDLSVIAEAPTEAYGAALAWLEPRRLVALVGVATINGSAIDPGNQPVVVVDPLTGEVLESPRLPVGHDDFHCAATEARGEALVVLFGRRLFVIDADGDFDTVRLPREFARCGDVTASPGGESAFAVSSAGDLVVEIALPSAKSEVRRLGRPVAGSLEAIALDRRQVVLAHRGPKDEPRGVSIVDMDRERREPLDPRAGDARVVAGTILAFVSPPDRGSGGIGVRGYTPNGKRKFAVLGGSRPATLEPFDRFAYALMGQRFAIIDVNAGVVVHRSSSPTRVRPGALLQRDGPLVTEAEE